MFLAGTEEHGVLVSTDAGRSWTRSNAGLEHPTVYAIAVDPAGAIFVGTHGGGVYRSDDGGKSWKQRAEGLTNRDVHSLVASRQRPGVVYAGTLNGGLFRSEDGGKTWSWSSQEDAQVWGLSLASGGAAVREAQDSAYEARARRLLEVAASEPDTSFFTAAARIRLGRELPVAYAMLDSMTHDRAIGGMFYAYTLIGTYLHCRDVLPDSLHRKIREAFRVRTMYRGDTENHWVMYYTGLYLAAQTWPGESGDRWFNGKSSEENFREAAEWLAHWMRSRPRVGQGEFDSPTYMTVFLCPMLVLQEFAADPG